MLRKIGIIILTLVFLTGCSGTGVDSSEKYSTTLFAMDTVMDLSIYGGGETVLDGAATLINDLERLLSTTDSRSEIYNLNKNGYIQLSEDTAKILKRALELCRETDGSLDISIYPIVREWGFTTGNYKVPDATTLAELLAHVDYTQIELSQDSSTVSLPDGMEIDLGSIAKGYTGDVLIQYFIEQGVSSAIVSLGGNVQTLGSKPDGTDWIVAIQSPTGNEYLGSLTIANEAVITSGGYERNFTDSDGNVYWHIIDPETGYPAKNGLISVTIVGPEGAYCDALSTALFVMGTDKAIDFWQDHGDFDMILVTENDEVLITPDLSERFQLTDAEYCLAVIDHDEN